MGTKGSPSGVKGVKARGWTRGVDVLEGCGHCAPRREGAASQSSDVLFLLTVPPTRQTQLEARGQGNLLTQPMDVSLLKAGEE